MKNPMKNHKLYRVLFAGAAVALCVPSAPARATETDDKIEASFESSYVYKTYLSDDSIKIEAKEGIATLTGTVAEDSHKTLAQETAASLPGVTRVDNQLANEAEVAAANADTWIGRKLKLALMFHRNVNAGDTTIQVKDGIVTLTGVAANSAQKDLTGEYAKDIEGVKEVRNEMTIASPPVVPQLTTSDKMDDASISAQVKTALMTHRSTSAIQTKVTTLDGKVTVTGIAANDAEKALVTKLANDIHGVSSVDNQMTIAVPRPSNHNVDCRVHPPFLTHPPALDGPGDDEATGSVAAKSRIQSSRGHGRRYRMTPPCDVFNAVGLDPIVGTDYRAYSTIWVQGECRKACH